MLATLPLGLLALGAAGTWFYLAQRQYLMQTASANLMAIAQARVDQIVAWRAERLGDAAVLQENPLFTRAVARWLDGHQPGIAADILRRLRSSKDHYRYDDVRLVDRAGRVALATSGRLGALDAGEAAAVRAAFRVRRATMGEVYISPGDTIPHLVVVAPLFALNASATEPLGAVVHVVDAQRSLFHLVESWPSPSPSAEAVLVRRDGDSVRFVTPRRVQPDATPTPRIALSRRNVPAVMAVLGTEGVVRGVDYRGVRVIAALRAVPGTSWFLVAKVDEAEALAVWRTRVALVFAVFLGLVLVAAATAVADHQRLAKAHYRRLYEAEAALGASEARYRHLFESMEQGVVYHAADGRIVSANPAAERILGITLDQMIGRTNTDPRWRCMRDDGSDLPGEEHPAMLALRSGRPVLGTMMGVFHPVENRHRWILVDAVPEFRPGGATPFRVHTTFSDITDRKRAEEALRESDARFQGLFNRMSSGVAVYDAVDDGGDFIFRDFNPAAEKIENVSRNDILGRRVSEVFPGVRAFGLFEVFQRVWQTGNPEYVPGNIYRDARSPESWRESWVFKLPTGEIVAIYNEISERKRTEAALRALARHLDSVREEEHTRIARQVHDELGQALTALRLDLTWVGRKLPKADMALRRRVDAAVALTDEMIAVGHHIVGELRPPILDDLGLVPAVEWHAQQVAKRSGVRIQVECAAEERVVAGDLAVSAYRIVQEALANVVRHAQAKHVRVRLGEQDGGLTVEIRDDGQGFPEEAASDPRSFGITGMRERAASLGGTLAITGSPGAGTTVRVTFPPERRKEPRAPR
jgi:PAS domain S-box-containing protein